MFIADLFNSPGRLERTWGWARTRRYDGPSNDLEPLSPHQSYPDCIIATRGYDFREGQDLPRRYIWNRVKAPQHVHGLACRVTTATTRI
jgi:hypothetical protein